MAPAPKKSTVGSATDKAKNLRRVYITIDPDSEAHYRAIALEKFGRPELSLGIREAARSKRKAN